MKHALLMILLGGALSFLLVGFFGLGFHRSPRYIQNFEEMEYGQERAFIEPHSVRDGLAVYSVGGGDPVLLFPYPHAHTIAPMAQEPLADLLVGLGRRVVTFDVPGAYRSTRSPTGDMEEMIGAALETLDRLGIEGPVDVVGHSMGGLAALAFAIEQPQRTNRLVLIGTFSGFPAAARWGMPGSVWNITDAEFWQLAYWGIKVKTGRGSFATHKRLQNLMERASYYDEKGFTPLEIQSDDNQKGIPIREIVWGKNMARRLSYADKLGLVRAPTLILAGGHDPEAPLPCSQELQAGISGSTLVTFARSGHLPFIEEAQRFAETVDTFLNSNTDR